MSGRLTGLEARFSDNLTAREVRGNDKFAALEKRLGGGIKVAVGLFIAPMAFIALMAAVIGPKFIRAALPRFRALIAHAPPAPGRAEPVFDGRLSPAAVFLVSPAAGLPINIVLAGDYGFSWRPQAVLRRSCGAGFPPGRP